MKFKYYIFDEDGYWNPFGDGGYNTIKECVENIMFANNLVIKYKKYDKTSYGYCVWIGFSPYHIFKVNCLDEERIKQIESEEVK